MSLPEVLLWQAIRRGQHGARFRRQHPVGPYILDFFCAEAGLAIEIDGYSHGVGDRAAHDQRRDDWLAWQGIRVLRLSAELVLSDMDGAIETIQHAVTSG